MLVERIGSGLTLPIDTISVDEKGDFEYITELPAGEPTLYTFHLNGRDIVLLLSAGERVKLNSAVGMVGGYTVEGSKESELIREVTDILNSGAARLDSIMNNYSLDEINESERKTIGENYAREYYKIKRSQIGFIVENKGSLASLYALYQRLPNDPYLATGNDNDLLYYRMVADSLEHTYPTSPYLATLRRQIIEAEGSIDMQRALAEMLDNPIPYPEIEMNDMYGQSHKLTSTLGKVVLLDFWSTSDEQSSYNNAEMKELYEEFGNQGFEIYQVSVDNVKANWINAVQQQHLPWISVWDSSKLPMVLSHYALSTIPANFLMDREGNIVARNIFGDNMRQAVQRAIK